VLVVTEVESCQHRQIERSHSRKQQALFCVRVHEGKPVPDDQGQVSSSKPRICYCLLTWPLVCSAVAYWASAWKEYVVDFESGVCFSVC